MFESRKFYKKLQNPGLMRVAQFLSGQIAEFANGIIFSKILEYATSWIVVYIKEILQNPASSVHTKLHSFYLYI